MATATLAKYRLKPGVGAHVQTDADGIERRYHSDGSGAGNEVEAPTDLARRWPEKFEFVRGTDPSQFVPPPGFKLVPVDDAEQGKTAQANAAPAAVSQAAATQPAPAAPKPAPAPLYTQQSLQALTLDQLRSIAADEEIEVKGTPNKEQLVKLILGTK